MNDRGEKRRLYDDKSGGGRIIINVYGVDKQLLLNVRGL